MIGLIFVLWPVQADLEEAESQLQGAASEGGWERRHEQEAASLWEELRCMIAVEEEEEAAKRKRRVERTRAGRAGSGSGSGQPEALDPQRDEKLSLSIPDSIRTSDQIQIHSDPASSKAVLLGQAVIRMGVMRDQNRRMARLLRRLERESGLLARMDSLHRENTALHAKNTAIQVGTVQPSWK